MAALDSGLRDIRTYLHGESVKVHGAQARLNWLPADLPRVPIDLAASGPATIALGATVADRLTFNLGADPALIAWAVATARRAREQSGLDPDGISLGAFVNVACDPEIPTALRMVRGGASIFIRFLAEAMARSDLRQREQRALRRPGDPKLGDLRLKGERKLRRPCGARHRMSHTTRRA